MPAEMDKATRAAFEKAWRKRTSSHTNKLGEGIFLDGVEQGRTEAIDLAKCMGMEFKEGALFNTRADRAKTKLEAVRNALAVAVKEADGEGD